MKLRNRRQCKLWFALPLLMVISYATTLAQVPNTVQEPADNEYLAGAILWAQTSGEMRALTYQAFNLARMMLDRDLKVHRRSRMKRAVVVDVDETVIDNSPYQATLLKNRQNYNGQSFTDWVNLVRGTAVPGSVEFLAYATSRGVRVYYITNRKLIEKDATAANLTKLGFSQVNDQTLLVRTDGSSKEPRRQLVGKRHRIVLLIGDNLNDFAEVFETSKTVDTRLGAVESNKAKFGTRFIMLPNAMYGDWESAVYDYNFTLSEKEKAAKRRSLLKTLP